VFRIAVIFSSKYRTVRYTLLLVGTHVNGTCAVQARLKLLLGLSQILENALAALEIDRARLG
jgi:hypothetical protein